MEGMTLDQAISAVTAAEATYVADSNSVAAIQAAITQAQAPLPAAQATVASDVGTYNSTLDSLISAATAAKIPVPPPA